MRSIAPNLGGTADYPSLLYGTDFFIYKHNISGLYPKEENMKEKLYTIPLNDAVNAKVYCNSLTQFVMVFSNNAAMATQIIVGHLQ